MNKVPPITLLFWIIKIIATTLGETACDYVSMSLGAGYFISIIIFTVFFALTLVAQIRASRFRPVRYWSVILATTILGTAICDYLDRTLGLGYGKGSALLIVTLAFTFGCWYRQTGSLNVQTIVTPRIELLYWLAILISNTLGTALGDFLSNDAQLGFGGGALLLGSILLLIALVYYFTSISRTALFWAAFILTRPLGATLGDLFTKPLAEGGLHLDRLVASLILGAFFIAGIWFSTKQTAKRA